MVRANLIQNGVSVNMYGYNEEIGIGDYVIIVTENKEKSKFNTVAKVVDYNDKYILFDNSSFLLISTILISLLFISSS